MCRKDNIKVWEIEYRYQIFDNNDRLLNTKIEKEQIISPSIPKAIEKKRIKDGQDIVDAIDGYGNAITGKIKNIELISAHLVASAYLSKEDLKDINY